MRSQLSARFLLLRRPEKNMEHQHELRPHKTVERHSPTPYNLTLFKGYKEVVLNRTEAAFLLDHPVSRQVLAWMADVYIPDEAFYATMTRTRIGVEDGLLRQEDSDSTAFCLSTRC